MNEAKRADVPEPPAGGGEKAARTATAAPSPHAVRHSKLTILGMWLFFGLVAVGLWFVYRYGIGARQTAASDLAEDAKRAAGRPRTIDVVRLAEAPAETSLILPGEARAFHETTIFARTNGYLSKWNVDIGDQVTSGQGLALIETPELDDQVAAAQAKSDMLKAEVRVAETAVNFARVSLGRWEAAVPEGAVSQQERDQKKAELESSVARLDAAKSQVVVSDAEVQRLKTLISFKSVTAPFEGIITRRLVDVGALVTAGSTTNTSPLFRITQSNQIRLIVDVPEVVIPSIKVGMDVIATARELPHEKFGGKVDRRAEWVDPASKTLRVEALVPNPALVLLPGMYVQVEFKTVRTSLPICVPSGALCFRATGPHVALVGPDHRVTFRRVEIFRDLGDVVEVGSGLHRDDLVGLNIGNGIGEGDLVDPREVAIRAAGGEGTGRHASESGSSPSESGVAR